MSSVRVIEGPNGPIAKLLNASDADVDAVMLSARGQARSVWQWCLFEDGSLALLTMPFGTLNRSLRQRPALAPLFAAPRVTLYCYMKFAKGSYCTGHSTDPGIASQSFNDLGGERLRFEIEVPDSLSQDERAAEVHTRGGQIYGAIWTAQRAQ